MYLNTIDHFNTFTYFVLLESSKYVCTVGPCTMLAFSPQRCSTVQISTVQGSVFQHCARYFISINPRFQCYESYFISINPRFQCNASFLSVVIQGSALCKNFQEILVISTIPRSALFESPFCKALVYLK